MPSSAVHHFTAPDDYATAIRGTKAELTLTEHGRFTAKLIRIDLHRLLAQRYAENLPRVMHSANMTGRAMISFLTEPGPSLLAGGLKMYSSTIIQHSEAQNYFQRSSGSACFGTLSLPVADIVSVGAAIAGLDLTPPNDARTLTPAPYAIAKLRRLHAAAGQLAEDAAEIIAHLQAARGLEQALIEALVGCLSIGEVREDRLAQRHHSLIIRRFRRVVEENPDQPLYMPELCTAIRVSERTLRACCQEQLGMSPKRYLLLRRIHSARRALRGSAPGATTVTEIATQYGFWHFCRKCIDGGVSPS